MSRKAGASPGRSSVPFWAVREFGRAFYEVQPKRRVLALGTYVESDRTGLAFWLNFHRGVGAQHFFLCHHDEGAGTVARIKAAEDRGDITVWSCEPDESPAEGLLRMAKTARGSTRWLALTGPNDFLFSPESSDLRDVLRNFESYPGIAVFPYEFPDLEEAAAADGVFPLRRVQRYKDFSRSTCAIVNPVMLRKIRRDGSVILKAGRELVNEHGRIAIDENSNSPSAQRLRLHRYPDEGQTETSLFRRRAGDLWRVRGQGIGERVEDRTLADRVRASGEAERGRREKKVAGGGETIAPWARAAVHALRETRRRLPRRRYLSMGMMFKDSAPYLVEWIEFHRLVGFEHFYLYSQGSTDDSVALLEPYCDAGLVTLEHWPADQVQQEFFAHCFERAAMQTRWLALVDDDEFLYPVRGDSLAVELRDYEEFGGVVVPWLMFGSSGHRKKPEGLVIENFTRRSAEVFPLHKCIVDPARLQDILDPHHFRLEGGYAPVNEMREIEPFSESRRRSIERFRLNHYYTKSYEEAETKITRRGHVPGSATDDEQNRRYLGAALDDGYNAVEDRTIQRYLPALREAVRHPAQKP